MKKILAIIIGLFVVFSVAACQTTTQTIDYVFLYGIEDHEVYQGDSLDLLDGVSAGDNYNNDQTSEITVSSDCPIIDNQYLDTTDEGDCTITYAISVGGVTQSATSTVTVLKRINDPTTLTVYFQKPDSWDTVHIYYYDANITFNTTWAAAPEMTPVLNQEGWYQYVFPAAVTSIHVEFRDETYNQLPPSTQEGELVTETTWFYSDYYSYTTENPLDDTEDGLAEISLSTVNAIFSDDLMFTIDITSDTTVTDMYFTVNSVIYDLTSLHEEINLGADFYTGERLVITVYVTNSAGTEESTTYLFIKSSPTELEPLTIREEFNNITIYQIYVDAYQDGDPSVGYAIGYGPSSHQGDLQAIIDALDYIASLNVNPIWLTPIFTSKENASYSEWEERGRSTGYFADDYYHIDPNFGTDELFRELVNEAHARGLYVFLDGVFGHHGSYAIDGVTDGDAQWYGYEIVYPESLEYFIDVAQYWILEYGIDGYRLDQSYQLYQDDTNFWREIRIAVEQASLENAAAGKTWGTLGYMVGEDWESVSNINLHAYSQNGLRSAFDFPLRYAVIASISGMDESYWTTATFYDINNAMNTAYLSYAQPNLFLTNHDVVRFGDLLQLAGNDGDEYYARHKMALSFLAQYTGPITIYYGDEYGDEAYVLQTSYDDLNSISDVAIDNVARTNGQITGFDTYQLDLINYTSTIMGLRQEYSAMYNGVRTNLTVTADLYVDLKVDDDNSILYGLNRLTSSQTRTYSVSTLGGSTLTNLLTGDKIYASNGYITVSFDGLSGMFFLISD